MLKRSKLSIGALVGALVIVALVPGSAFGQTAGADLSLGGQINTVRNGGTVSFDWRVDNDSSSAADNAILVTEFSVPVRLESAYFVSPGCSSTSPTTITCDLGTIAGQDAAGANFSVTPLEYGEVTSTTTVSSDTADPSPENNSSTHTHQISTAQETDLALDLFGFGPTAYAGRPFYYLVQVRNNGPRDGVSTKVVLDLADGLVFDDERTTAPCSESGGIVTCELGDVGVETGFFQVWVTPSEAGTYTTTGTVTSDLSDPESWNDSVTDTTTAQPVADLRASITESSDPVRSGRPLTYTITVTNDGPSDATGVVTTLNYSSQVDGFHPMKIDVRSITTTHGTCNAFTENQTYHCNIGNLADGETATITTTLVARGAGTLWNDIDTFSNETDFEANNRPRSETTIKKGATK